MRTLFVTGIAIGLMLSATAQSDCMGGRYVDYNLFANVAVTSDVLFGQNTGVNGQAQDLFLDVYEPTGDTYANRPVVVVGFGGSFVAGAKEDVAFICETFAKMGYVAVAPDYRVGLFFPTSYTTSSAVMRGAHDMKAAVRYLYKSVLVDNNPFGIDTTRIILGGISAGAISALHAVYLDQESEMPAVLAPDSAGFGGVPGNSGNLGYSEKVKAVWSMSGAIADTLMIEAGDEPLISIHDVGDGVVPFYSQQVSVLGIPTGLDASGSNDIHRYMNTLGIDNCLKSYPGNGHVDYLMSDFTGSIAFLADFLLDNVCGQPIDCGSIFTSVNEYRRTELAVYPNPSSAQISFETTGTGTYLLTDALGNVVLEGDLDRGEQTLNISTLAAGSYWLEIAQMQGRSGTRVVKY